MAASSSFRHRPVRQKTIVRTKKATNGSDHDDEKQSKYNTLQIVKKLIVEQMRAISLISIVVTVASSIHFWRFPVTTRTDNSMGTIRPRVIFPSDNLTFINRLQSIIKYHPSRRIEFYIYDYIEPHYPDPFIEGDCVAMKPWQTISYPSCNLIHEFDFIESNPPPQFLNNGYFRDVWKLVDTMETDVVMKMLRYSHDIDERNLDRHRRDSLALERLTSSPFTVNTFGFCGNSGLFEYGHEGDIENYIWDSTQPRTTLEVLQVAMQVANGVADAHTFDGKYTSIAHTDITPSQFIRIDGVFKLNDFNRARFIRWNKALQEPCAYWVTSNPGKFRSPEEYKYDPQSEKVDVYSTCNVFYLLLTNEWPFDDMSDHQAQDLVLRGMRPAVSDEILEKAGEDPSIDTLLSAMNMCYHQDPIVRASARDVADFLTEALDNIIISQSTPSNPGIPNMLQRRA